MELEKPQILAIVEKAADYTPFDCRWVPCSAKYLLLGSRPNNSGVLQIYELNSAAPTLITEVRKEVAFKCCTFGASSLKKRHLATGNFGGKLEIWDIENWDKPIYEAEAHSEIINSIEGFGGQNVGCGAPEIVTAGRDGLVKVWDPRQKGKPVVVMEPTDTNEKRDCWSVTFGNAYNSEERIVCAGYDNGDIKMFDLRNMSIRWETNIKNGVCSLEFDRKEIEMNKLVATTLESKFFVWDLRTQHPEKGFAHLKEKAHSSTIWAVRHLPQNREIFMTCGGNGSLCLWKYNYPEKRFREDTEGRRSGVVGSLSLLQNATLTSQPVASFHWCPDKTGLAVCTSYDQAHRVIIVTKLNLY